MASQFYADFTFSGDTSSSQYLFPLNNANLDHSYASTSAFPHHHNYVSVNNPTPFDDLYGSSGSLALYQHDVSPAAPLPTLLPERLGVPDMSVPEYNIIGACDNYVNNTTQYYHNGDECIAFSPDVKPFSSPATGDQYWGSEGGKQVPAMEETNTKIGRYSVEERKRRIMRYLKKKNQRNFNKTIKYVCRKTLADRRVRIRGRFARNNETCEQQSTSKNHNITDKEDEIYSGDDYLLQMEQEDFWVQEATSDVIYFPCDESYVAQHNNEIENTWSFPF